MKKKTHKNKTIGCDIDNKPKTKRLKKDRDYVWRIVTQKSLGLTLSDLLERIKTN